MARNMVTKRDREKKLVSQMIALYCKGLHKDKYPRNRWKPLGKVILCKECAELDYYARARSEKCPFMETKTFCSNCRVHCYKPDMQQRIRDVMRYSGPRMIFYHPVTAIRHVIESKKEKNGERK